MYHVKIKVTLRKSILDPQGKASENSLHSLNYDSVKNVRIGKYIELDINETDEEKTKEIVDEISHKLLSNPIMEDYTYELEKK
jgi:phosphoribosylformylglycinamidine synthase subunit PurS